MTSALEHRRAVPTDSEAILNALPNPVLLVRPTAASSMPISPPNPSSRFRRNFCGGSR